MSILEEIIAHKRGEVKERSARVSRETIDYLLSSSVPQTIPSFSDALTKRAPFAVIAEFKRGSPSKGIIRDDLQPVDVARCYIRAGAACMSILTDSRYFQGSEDDLLAVRIAFPHLPLLRKDFIVDPYQVWETKLYGASCVLLIVAALPEPELQEIAREVGKAGLDLLIEVHSEEEVDCYTRLAESYRGEHAKGILPLLGINNRDLRTFKTDISLSSRLVRSLKTNPSFSGGSFPIVIAESGLQNGADLKTLTEDGVTAFLIGESLMKNGSPEDHLRQVLAEAKGN